jgi:hypothetical protein
MSKYGEEDIVGLWGGVAAPKTNSLPFFTKKIIVKDKKDDRQLCIRKLEY